MKIQNSEALFNKFSSNLIFYKSMRVYVSFTALSPEFLPRFPKLFQCTFLTMLNGMFKILLIDSYYIPGGQTVRSRTIHGVFHKFV